MAEKSFSPQLCLRFACRKCKQLLLLPLHDLENAARTCPGCSAAVNVPPIDSSLVGFEVVAAAHQPEMTVECPGCRRKLQVPLNKLGRRRRCPACRRWLTFKLVPDSEESAEVGSHTSQSSRTAERGNGNPDRQAVSSKPNTAPAAPEISENEIEVVEQPYIVYDEKASQRSQAAAAKSKSSPFAGSPRLLNWVVWLIVEVVGVVGFAGLGTLHDALGFVALLFLIPRLSVARRITDRWLMPLLLPTIRCPGCDMEMEAIGQWTIGDYTDHRDRHVYHVRHPRNGGVIGQTDCPYCGSTILLR